MSCTIIELPGGGRAILCTSARAPKCIVCGDRSTRLCDGHDPEDVDGTCSAALCDRHTKRSGEHDLCPRHASPEAAAVFVVPALALREIVGRTNCGRRPRGRPVPREQLALDLAGGRR